MIINEIRAGGMEIWFVHDELFQLALLLDETAHIVRESPDWKDHPKGIVEHLELLCALFTAAAVATEAQNYQTMDKQVWFRRENYNPVLHKPE